ncbi:hypothetical protein [Streptomyces sp. SM12]|uniref:hypothetical protein n=1 Tax=Streptomyces sp. SM12 TaxID=1071602 RepID=UPI000CD538EC|nr:hypothetical protein [Streptomyces sp. SM12]
MSKESDAVAEAVLVFLGAMILLGALICGLAGVLMLLVGSWHSVRPAVPPIGYGESLLILSILWVATAPAFGTRAKK